MALTRGDFDRLVDEHGPALYRMAYRMVGDAYEAEDLVQETYRSAWKSRRRHDARLGERAWLATILRRRAADRWRRRRLPGVLRDDLHDTVGVEADDPAGDELTDDLQRALDRLPKPLREALLLVVVGELSHREAAEVMGVPLGTVLSRVSRARRRMRDELLTETQSP